MEETITQNDVLGVSIFMLKFKYLNMLLDDQTRPNFIIIIYSFTLIKVSRNLPNERILPKYYDW